jgi:hypothetical protein
VATSGFQRTQLLKARVPDTDFPPDTKELHFTSDRVKVPADDTTYWCHVHLLPKALQERKHHVLQAFNTKKRCYNLSKKMFNYFSLVPRFKKEMSLSSITWSFFIVNYLLLRKYLIIKALALRRISLQYWKIAKECYLLGQWEHFRLLTRRYLIFLKHALIF